MSKENAKLSPKSEGPIYNNKLLLMPALGLSPEQFQGMLLWDLWKARRALLNASFPCSFSQKGAQSWLLTGWCVENTLLNLCHKCHLGTCRGRKALCFSFRWRGVSKALKESDKQWGTVRLCMSLIPSVFLFPSEKKPKTVFSQAGEF